MSNHQYDAPHDLEFDTRTSTPDQCARNCAWCAQPFHAAEDICPADATGQHNFEWCEEGE